MVRHWNRGDVIPVFHQIETIANPKGLCAMSHALNSVNASTFYRHIEGGSLTLVRCICFELSNTKIVIRWATDHLLKATAHHICSGYPNNDHKCWERPEDIDTTRIACKIDSQNPSSDVAAEIAAAIAAASLAFGKTDFSYSERLIYAFMTDELLLKKYPDFWICAEDFRGHL